MKINMKKVLLTGTALVAVAGFGASANAVAISDNTLTAAGITNETLTTTVDGKYINLDLNNTDQPLGTGAVSGVNATHNATIYVYDSNADAAANTLTITGTTNSVSAAAGKTVSIVLARDNAAGNNANDVILTLNKNVVAAAGASINFTTTASAGGNNVLNFVGNDVATVNLGNGKIVLGGADDAVNFTRGAAGGQVITGAIDGNVVGNGLVNFNTTTANGGTTMNSAIGASKAVKTVTVGNDATLTTAQNITATGIVLGNAGSVLNLHGGTSANSVQTITAGGSNLANGGGTINVGRIAGGGLSAINANVVIAGVVNGTGALNVAKGSTLTIGSNVTQTTINSDGTLNVTSVNNVNLTGAIQIDGVLNSNTGSARTDLQGAGVPRTLTFAGASAIGNAESTTINTANEIVSTGNITLGHAADARTVTLNIGRNDFYQATTNNSVAGQINGLDVLSMGGNNLTFANAAYNTGATAANNKLVIGLNNNAAYSFDHNDVLDVVVGAAGGANTITFNTGAGVLNQNVVLQHSALVRMTAVNTNGDWLAADASNLTVRLTHVNPNSVIQNEAGASVATALMNINDTNYGSRWGEQAEVNAAAPIAANGVGKGALGQIQGNAANLANGNVLRAARNNLLTARTAHDATEVAESLTTTVDGGHVLGALNATNGTFGVANDRLASLRTGSTGMAAGNGAGHRFWLQGFGATADQDRRDGVDGYDADTYGFAVGLDTESLHQNGVVGVAFSYGDTDVDSRNANRTKSEIDTYQITLYGDYDLDQSTFINGMLAYSWHDVSTLRHNVGGIAGINARGDFDAHQWTAEASVGRDYAYDSMILTPSVLAHYTHYSADGYTETGAGNASLIVDQDNLSKFELGVGVNAAWNFQTASGANFEPSLHAGYRYDFIGDEVETTNRFVGGGAAFNAQGADPSKHAFNVGGAMSLYSNSGWEFTANYDYDFKSDYDAHSGYLRAGVKF